MAHPNDSDPNGLGLPPLAPLEPENDGGIDSPPPPPPSRPAPRRRSRASVPAPDSLIDQSEEDERIRILLEDDENAGATVEVGRKTHNNKWAFCCSYLLADWSSDSKMQVAEQFGGGSYRATIKRSDKTIASNFTFEIDPAVKPKTRENSAQQIELLMEKFKPSDNSGNMLQMMQAQMSAQQTMMMQFMQMQAQQSADNMKALVQIMARPVAQAPAPNEKIVEILLAKALDNRGGMDLPKVIEAVAKLRSVANGGDGGDEDDEEEGGDIFSAVLKSLPGLVGLIGQGAARHSAPAEIAPAAPAATANPRPRRPAPAQPAPAAPAPAAPAPTVKVNKDVLALFLPQVVGLAEQNQTAAQAAAAIRDALHEGQTEALVELLRQDNWLDILIDAHGPVMKWTKWFAELRAVLIAQPKPAVDGEVEVVSP